MKKVLRRRPSPAAIIAIIALVLALAGTAVAGSGFLTTKKFKKQAVRGPVTYATSTVALPNTTFGGSGFDLATACPAGTHVFGGGIKVSSDSDAFVNDSHPTTAGWAGTVFTQADNLTATITAICATVKGVSGAPPAG
jgi:hypothetical protein